MTSIVSPSSKPGRMLDSGEQSNLEQEAPLLMSSQQRQVTGTFNYQHTSGDLNPTLEHKKRSHHHEENDSSRKVKSELIPQKAPSQQRGLGRFSFWRGEDSSQKVKNKFGAIKSPGKPGARPGSVAPDLKTLYKPNIIRNEKLMKTKEEIQKRYETYYNKWRDYDLLTSILSILGLVVAIIDHEFCLDVLQPMPYAPNLQCADTYVRFIVTMTSVLAIVSITLRHYQKTQWLNYELPKDLQQEVYSLKVFDNTWKKTRHRNFISKSYIMELVLISIHPLPYWDPQFSVSSINLTDKKKYVLTYYRASHVLLAFMFVRMLFLLRTIFNYSMFTDLYSKRLCQTYGFTANVRFTFKCMIIRNPGLTVVCTLTASTFILAYILRIFEIEYYRSINQIDFDNYFQAIWVIVVTMTTVGFGDLVPYSYIGRIIIMVTSFWGAFLISLVIVSVSKIFELTRNQKKAMHHLFLTRKAASSITSAMRYFMAKKRQKKTQAYLNAVQSGTGDRSVSMIQSRPTVLGSFMSPQIGRQQNTNLNWSMDMEEELMISERVEAQDLKEYHNLMTNRLAEFREEWNELKHLRIQAENEQEQMIYLIKNEVIDLADRFDEIQVSMVKQQKLLETLVHNQMLLMSERQGTISHNVSREHSDHEESSFIVQTEEMKKSVDQQESSRKPRKEHSKQRLHTRGASNQPSHNNNHGSNQSSLLSPNMSSVEQQHSTDNHGTGGGQSLIHLVQGIKSQDNNKISFRKSPFYQRQRSKIAPRISVMGRQQQIMSQFSQQHGGESSDDEGGSDDQQSQEEENNGADPMDINSRSISRKGTIKKLR